MKKTNFQYKSLTIPAGDRTLAFDFEGEFIFFYNVTGAVNMKLQPHDDSFPTHSGLKFRFKAGEHFKSVYFQSDAGGIVNFYYGVGDVSFVSTDEGGGGSGSTQILRGILDDPNDSPVYTPADTNAPAIYYKEDTTISLWIWSVVSTSWFPAIT